MFIHTLMHLVSQVLLQALIMIFVLGFKYVLKAFDPDSRSVYDLSIEEVVLFTRRLRLLSNPHGVPLLHTLLLIEVLACHTVIKRGVWFQSKRIFIRKDRALRLKLADICTSANVVRNRLVPELII